MNIDRAEFLVLNAMHEHGLTGWLFGWADDAIRNGTTWEAHDGSVKMIRLSRQLTMVRTEDNVINTILHEVAHALVGVEHGHDSVFSEKARELGVKPTADSPAVLLARMAATR